VRFNPCRHAPLRITPTSKFGTAPKSTNPDNHNPHPHPYPHPNTQSKKHASSTMSRHNATTSLPTEDPTLELDARTLLLIRRILCSHSPPTTPLEELLPALTSSTETDVEVYALIAIAARDYIFSWYAGVSNDSSFVLEVVALIAHITRGLEERLRKVDLEVLLLDEVPAVVEAHVRGSWLWGGARGEGG